MIVSCEASSKFQRTMLPKHNRSHAQDNEQSNQFQELKICISPQSRAMDPTNPRRGFIQQNQNVRIATAACHPKMYVSLQRRAPKWMNPAHDVRGNPRHTNITILPQLQTSDQHEVTRWLRRRGQNLHFTTVLDVR